MSSSWYLSPNGSDSFSGRLSEANAARTDGPFLTLDGARRRLRALKGRGELSFPAMVHIAPGRYPLKRPVRFEAADSGAIVYRALPGETPVFDGGEAISGFREETRADGKRLWITDLPDVAAGRWYFRSLFVDGQRRPRPMWPKLSEPARPILSVPGVALDAEIFCGTHAFVTDCSDVLRMRNQSDVEALVAHFWVEERMPLADWNAKTGLLRSTHRGVFVLRNGYAQAWANYRLDNVFEALNEPGEWYLDRAEGRLYYLPLEGQMLATTHVVAPRVSQFLVFDADPALSQFVEHLTFEGLSFIHGDWQLSSRRASEVLGGDHLGEDLPLASDIQAAIGVSGAISMRAARFVTIEDCHISAIGGYAIEMTTACVGNRIVGNHLHDLGGGGVKIVGVGPSAARHDRTNAHRITDNHIHHIGQVYKPAIGIIVCHGFENTIIHNHIHDTHYSGISVGWTWGYADSVCRDNRIEFNHIHHIGQGSLSDMGGIYTLGVQPGTTIKNNHIHHVRTAQYGGWAIYPDEGSSHIVIENNVCHDTDSSSFHTHYGRELIVRNNVFAFGGEGTVALGRLEAHTSFTLTGNILVSSGQPIHVGAYNGKLAAAKLYSDGNLLFDSTAPEGIPMGGRDSKDQGGKTYSLSEIRELGWDRGSRIGDPMFVNLAERDLRLRPDSPALAMGFRPIEMTRIGPRAKADRDDDIR